MPSNRYARKWTPRNIGTSQDYGLPVRMGDILDISIEFKVGLITLYKARHSRLNDENLDELVEMPTFMSFSNGIPFNIVSKDGEIYLRWLTVIHEPIIDDNGDSVVDGNGNPTEIPILKSFAFNVTDMAIDDIDYHGVYALIEHARASGDSNELRLIRAWDCKPYP